jgi:hypothetical protein
MIGRLSVVLSIILIMAGGIMLADNNMRELQGRERVNAVSQVSSQLREVSEQAYLKASSLRIWSDKILQFSLDMLKSAQRVMRKVLERADQFLPILSLPG